MPLIDRDHISDLVGAFKDDEETGKNVRHKTLSAHREDQGDDTGNRDQRGCRRPEHAGTVDDRADRDRILQNTHEQPQDGFLPGRQERIERLQNQVDRVIDKPGCDRGQ